MVPVLQLNLTCIRYLVDDGFLLLYDVYFPLWSPRDSTWSGVYVCLDNIFKIKLLDLHIFGMITLFVIFRGELSMTETEL